jgi:hypothetical protein
MSYINLSKSVPDFNNIFTCNNNNNNISIKNIIHNKNKYKLIKYNKTNLCNDSDSTFGLCRSIIANDDDKIICFSPPKSINPETFMQKYPTLDNNFIVEEFVEGTMINLFYNKDTWEISTKSVIGANTRFFKTQNNMNFRKMFFEAFNKCGLTYDILNQDYCYSFVLQHPLNRIVVPFIEPSLKLVGVYHIETNVDGDIIVNLIDKYVYWMLNLNSSQVQLNDIYETQQYDLLTQKYASNDTQYNVLGFIVYNKLTGERMKVRNPKYEKIKALRGNQTKLQFQYLSLRTQGNVKEYLKFFPENKRDFSKFRDDVHQFTSTLYTNYRSCYVKKEKPLNEFESQFKTHMYHIHQIFLTKLKNEHKYITINSVVEYVNSLKPNHFMYSLNFHLRKPIIKVEQEACV